MNIRIGNGLDIHKLAKGKKFILGGIEIDSIYGITAFSDGDIVIHALVDSILGALSLGDIGTYFPSNDSKWNGVNSVVFLNKAIDEMVKLNYQIINIDITIILQKPSLSKYKEIIKKNLSSLLKLNKSQVSIKATTSDKLGFIGREEGIAVFVTTLLTRNGS
mgnify:CR=1 FL=1